MKSKWGLQLCWNLLCLLFFVSYTSKAIRVSVPKLRSQEAHDEHNLELSASINADTASLIRSRRGKSSSNSHVDCGISNFTHTTVISFRDWFTAKPSEEPSLSSQLRWIGNSSDQVSQASPVKLSTFTLVFTAFDHPFH